MKRNKNIKYNMTMGNGVENLDIDIQNIGKKLKMK